MIEKKSIARNYFFNLIGTTLNLLIPLVTTPYVSRILGAEAIGKVSYTQAIISYIVIFGSLGLGIYAVRQVAYSQGNQYQLNKVFSNLLAIKILVLIPAIVVYALVCVFYKEYTALFLSEIFFLLAEVVNVDWFFSGNENFELLVVKGIIFRVIGVICIFIFVKNPSDVYLYEIIMGGMILFGNLVPWRYVLKTIKFQRPSLHVMKKYLVGGLILFAPQVAGSMYLYCDKLMLGLMSNNIVENGYYEQTQKIIRLAITGITALPTVMLPKISSAYGKKDSESITRYMTKSLDFVLALGIPMMLGIIAISDNIVPWFLGCEFNKVSLLLKICAPIVLFNAIYNITGYQYLLATKQEKVDTITILIGAILNVLLNCILIKKYASIGASIASVCAEFIVMLLQIIYIGKVFEFKDIVRNLIEYLFSGAIMLFLLRVMNQFLLPDILGSMALILIGILVYSFEMYLLKNSTFLYIFSAVKVKIKRNNRE